MGFDEDDLPTTVEKRRSPRKVDTPGLWDEDTLADPEKPVDMFEILSRVLIPVERLNRRGQIAEGGMGAIQLVDDNVLKRQLAMKVIHERLQREPHIVEMFVREAQITGQLDHPNIVPVHEVGLDAEGRLYFTMKLVEGRNFASMIREHGRSHIEYSTLLNLLDVVVKVCDALAFAHSRGVVHCDIKPENIMVGDFGEVYLMDWGLARLIGDTGSPETDEGTFVGTPAYMSPEQARGDNQDIDARSDIFGLGAILYEIVARDPPFARDSFWQSVAAAEACEFVPLGRQSLPVPRGLSRIVDRAMAKTKVDRYQSIAELKLDLLRFMRGGGQFPLSKVVAGTVILREGEPGYTAYIIVSGRCEVRKRVDEEEVVLRTMGPGDVFGETAILSPGPRTASVVAVEATTLRIVTQEVLEAEVDSMKPWMGDFIRALATRFREQEDRAIGRQPASPDRTARQLLMELTTFGEADPAGGVASVWSEVAGRLASCLAESPTRLLALVADFAEIEVSTTTDRVRISDLERLKRRLTAT